MRAFSAAISNRGGTPVSDRESFTPAPFPHALPSVGHHAVFAADGPYDAEGRVAGVHTQLRSCSGAAARIVLLRPDAS
jgi:hypothetical protein